MFIVFIDQDQELLRKILHNYTSKNLKKLMNSVLASNHTSNDSSKDITDTLIAYEKEHAELVKLPFINLVKKFSYYFNEPHEYHAISQTILNNIDKLTPDQKMELSKHQIIEPRELGLNNWIDKFVRNVLDKAIPKDQRPFYDQFMKNLNRVHLKDFIDKIIDLLVDNKWIKVLDLQEESVILEYPKSI